MYCLSIRWEHAVDPRPVVYHFNTWDEAMELMRRITRAFHVNWRIIKT